MNTFEKILQKEINSGKSPSAQYHFFDERKILASYQSGYTNIAKKRKVDDQTTYNAFSVTKTFTALAILQLAAQKLVDLDKPIIDYFSEFPYHPTITIRQILSHTSGIPNPIPLGWIHLVSEHPSFDQAQFFKRIFSKNKREKGLPNQKFLYSNLGYVLLGQLIEQLTKITYEDYITTQIIEKLPLSNNDIPFEVKDANRHATGYHKRWTLSNLLLGFFIDKRKFMGKPEDGWKSFQHFYVNGSAYGGLMSTPLGMVNYIQALLKNNDSLISDAYKQLLFQENKTNVSKNTGMCLSWFTGNLRGYQYYCHAGGGGGYYCEIRIYPKEKLGSVLFFNRSGMRDERFLDKLDVGFLGQNC